MGTKIHHKDYKHIQTMKSIDTFFYREGVPYLVKFNKDPKGEGIDYGDGAIGICIEASGGNLTFVFVKGTYVHEKYDTKCVSISCQYLDKSDIEIVPFWSDYEVLDLIDHVKRDPDKYLGAAYYNEEEETNMCEEITTPNSEVDGPDIKNFYISDYSNILGSDSDKTRYPLFVRDKHSGDRWIINYDVLCKALYRKDVIVDISFKMKKPLRAQGFCSCNSMDVEVHVGTTVLTGRRPGKKDAPTYDAAIEFRADDWKEMAFAHVVLRRK